MDPDVSKDSKNRIEYFSLDTTLIGCEALNHSHSAHYLLQVSPRTLPDGASINTQKLPSSKY